MKVIRLTALTLLGLFACTSDAPPVIPRADPIVSGYVDPDPPAGGCRVGPWASHCTEADWARRVVINAGFRLTGDQGSALELRHERLIFHFWASKPDGWQKKPLRRALADENYRELEPKISGTTVYTDGRRFAWAVHGLWAWLTSAGLADGTPGGTAEEIREGVLDDLVVATKDTPFPPQHPMPRCRPPQNHSYGDTLPGRWMKDVLVELGAPGGYALDPKDVRDTGTAWLIDVAEYNKNIFVYAAMLTKGNDPNIPSPPPQEALGEEGSYKIYFSSGAPTQWESYKAVGSRWQISLIAYPGADTDAIDWPQGTVDWLRGAAQTAEEAPPRCRGPLN